MLKSKKKAAEKIIFSRETQLRNDRRFQPIVCDRGITIYGHRNGESLLDEVVILQSKEQSPKSEHVCIVQMMGLLRPEDLVAYRQLGEPSPKSKDGKMVQRDPTTWSKKILKSIWYSAHLFVPLSDRF